MTEATDNAVRHFIARQPIFDRRQQVVAYELLFRDGWDNDCPAAGDDASTTSVLNNTLNITGLRLLLMGRKGFVNFTRNTLLARDHQVFPSNALVVELPPDLAADASVQTACRELKGDGYELALNIASPDAPIAALIDLADYVKIDLSTVAESRAQRIATMASKAGARRVAMQVETASDYVAATDMNCELIQGRFYCEPQIIDARDVPSVKRNYLAFLREVQRGQPDYDAIAAIVRQEVSLSVKLLRYLNTVAMGMGTRIESVHHALTLLGERPLRRWASLVALTCMGTDKAPELIVTTLVRARLCELIAGAAGMENRSFDLFMAGLLSTLDAMLDRPLDELLIDMPLAIDVKAALLGARSPIGTILHLTLACEQGDTTRIETLSRELHIAPAHVCELVQEAIHWAQSVI